MNNFIIIVLDGVGIGELPDAGNFKDEGSATLQNMADHLNGINLPNLEKAGLGNIAGIKGVNRVENPDASFGKMTEVSGAKDSTTGHWELGGVKVDLEFPYYPEGFPEEVIEEFKRRTGVGGVLGNKAASGTEIIKELGREHLRTGFPIVYTSADSVFQIAASEAIIPLKELYRICKIAREEVFTGKHSVGRVIARPFVEKDGEFVRTTNRKDFSIDPIEDTILDVLSETGVQTIAIGKVNDLFNYKGIKVSLPTKSNDEGIKKIIESCKNNEKSFIFANLVDFDVYYGHRNDPEGFYKELKNFDDKLSEILSGLDETDALIITADHGNDPTTPSTDHSREYVPVLFFRKNKSGRDLGIRKTFSDVAQTAAHFFKVNNNLEGESFLSD